VPEEASPEPPELVGWLVPPDTGAAAWVPAEADPPLLTDDAPEVPALAATPPEAAEDVGVVDVVAVEVVGVTDAVAAAPPGTVNAGAPVVSADGVPEAPPHAAIAPAENRPATRAARAASEGDRLST
jgi:hypothetical protein